MPEDRAGPPDCANRVREAHLGTAAVFRSTAVALARISPFVDQVAATDDSADPA
jgi:hypothetical protein